MALTLAAAVAQLTDFAVTGRLAPAFDLDSHVSVFGVVNLLSVGAAGAAVGVLARLVPGRQRIFGVLAVLLMALLALRIAQPPHVLYLSTPVAAVVLPALWWGSPPGPVRRLQRDACVVLVVAFAAHVVDERLVTGACCDVSRWEYHIRSVVKHGTELAGWVLVSGGFALAVREAWSRPANPHNEGS